MKKVMILVSVLLSILMLTGCFAEDYDVGVPRAYLLADDGLRGEPMPLTEANISWSSSSGEVMETIDDIEEFGLSQEVTTVSPSQPTSLDFKENEENGGDIWTDPTITASLWKDGEETKLELNESREFRFPQTEGNYILEVEFIDRADEAQYVGNIVIEEAPGQKAGQLPKYTYMEMPSITKIGSAESNGETFDHTYSEVCWNNCTPDSGYEVPDVHSGDAEVGDSIVIDWGRMEPNPSEIILLEFDGDGEEVSEEIMATDSSTVTIEVNEQKLGKQYSVQYLWQDGEKLLGHSSLDFKLK
ncbi:hypothetical protein [Planococcus citreus]|uniref:Uncharacterized protein n=1 Tax=Planococcus citreus TaxID=1373 RepID=A0A497YV29_9BACL|nr:hypothetical protein [Planococcus citreus]RLJ90754.1 hypothetical protein DFR62_0905 [Planococcus citreus]